MPSAIPVPIRQEIIHQHHQGASLAQIAAALSLSYWSVRNIVRRYRQQGEAGLVPNYDNCGGQGPRYDRRLYRGARWLKRHHPTWGAGLIAVLLQRRWVLLCLPSVRTIQRWIAPYQQQAPTKTTPPASHRERASFVHEVWQLDATSHQRLADGSGVSWITVVEEVSGSHLASQCFPPLCF